MFFEPNQLLEIIHRDHRKKQSLSLMLTFLNSFIIRIFIEEMDDSDIDDEMVTRELFEEEAVRTGKRIQKRIKKELNKVKRWEKEDEFINKLQELKEIGMYVGINKNGSIISSPKVIKAKDSGKSLEILGRYLDEWDGIQNWKWDENIELQLRIRNRLIKDIEQSDDEIEHMLKMIKGEIDINKYLEE